MVFVLNSSFWWGCFKPAFSSIEFSNAQYILGKNYIENLKIPEKQNFMLVNIFQLCYMIFINLL